MKRTRMFSGIAVLITLVLSLLAVPAQARLTASPPLRIDTRTQQWLAQAAPGASATFLVGLNDDGTQGQVDQAPAITNKLARRTRVHQLLSARAQRNEAALRAAVRERGLEGEVSAIHAFQTFNGFSITAGPRAIEALRRWNRVSSIELEQRIQLERPQPAAPLAQINAVEWNISKIGADQVQSQLGITGQGVVVGGLDTGVRYTHVALSANYKCAGTAHTACWRDAIGNQAAPYDDNGHGTHTMGTAVGSGGIGVAPGAKWIACKAFNSAGSGNPTAILTCFDWFLAPGGSAANAPDVVNNSWGSTPGSTTVYQQAVNNWVNAGIYPEFSNGNSGPGCGTVGAPASYTNAVGTGSTNVNDVIASTSSRGASPFGVIKPDLSAPGVSIRSAWSTGNSAYNTISGTSMAGPHVSGLVALLLQANSGLTIGQLTANMKANALSIAATGCSSSGVPNNIYGWGRIRAFQSVQAALGSGTPTPTPPPTSTPTPIPTSTPTPIPTSTPTPTPGSGPTVTLMDWSVTGFSGSSTAEAWYYVAGTGDIIATEYCSGCSSDVGDWISPKTGMGNYEVRAFNGCPTGPWPYGVYGQFGTWMSADTAGAWGVYIYDINQSVNCSIEVQIRAKNNPSVILDTAMVYFNLWTGL